MESLKRAREDKLSKSLRTIKDFEINITLLLGQLEIIKTIREDIGSLNAIKDRQMRYSQTEANSDVEKMI